MLAKKIFQSRGFDFQRDFTESVYRKVMDGEAVKFEDKSGNGNPVWASLKSKGILIQTWNANIGIHITDAQRGYNHIMELARV